MKKTYLSIVILILFAGFLSVFFHKKNKKDNTPLKIGSNSRVTVYLKRIDSLYLPYPVNKIAYGNGITGIYSEDNPVGNYFTFNSGKIQNYTIAGTDYLFDNISTFKDLIAFYKRKTGDYYIIKADSKEIVYKTTLPFKTFDQQIISDSTFYTTTTINDTTYIGLYNVKRNLFSTKRFLNNFILRDSGFDLSINAQGRFAIDNNTVCFSFLKSSDFFITDKELNNTLYYYGKDSFAFPKMKINEIGDNAKEYTADPNINYVLDSKLKDSSIYQLMNFRPKGLAVSTAGLVDVYDLNGHYRNTLILKIENPERHILKILVTEDNKIWALLNDNQTLLKYE